VVAISSFGRSQLYRWIPYTDWPKVEVVHCGLEAVFHAGAARAVPSAPRLVCVGRLCEQKGQLLLVRAVAQLAAEGVALELVLAGDGEMRAEIEALITRHGLQAMVRITGWISSDQVREELLAARALTLPSFAEGLPVVVMEAMALRRPVLTTYVAGIAELVRDRSITPGLNYYRANVPPASLTGPPLDLPPIAAPAMGVWSDDDFALLEEQMTGSADYCAGGWRYERIEGAGHWFQWEQPERTNELLLDFLPR